MASGEVTQITERRTPNAKGVIKKSIELANLPIHCRSFGPYNAANVSSFRSLHPRGPPVIWQTE
jgi:hypothetical protein